MFPRMIQWGVRTMAPAVPPGPYPVRLTVGGTVVESAQVEVAPHAWIAGVTVEDLEAQCEFGVPIRANVDAANRAVIAIRGATARVDERLEASDDARSREVGALPLQPAQARLPRDHE